MRVPSGRGHRAACPGAAAASLHLGVTSPGSTEGLQKATRAEKGGGGGGAGLVRPSPPPLFPIVLDGGLDGGAAPVWVPCVCTPTTLSCRGRPGPWEQALTAAEQERCEEWPRPGARS